MSFPDQQARLLTSWLPEIVAKLRPGAPQQASNGEIRVGRKGSLALYADGGWIDYESDHGGHGALSLIAHDLGAAAARQFSLDWLETHPGIGSFTPTKISEFAARERAERHAAWARQVINRKRAITGTGSALNLASRGLPGPYPDGLLGHLDDARLGEAALVALLTNATGEVLGVQLGYLAQSGAKSALVPQRNLFWITLDPEERRTGLFRIPASPRTGDEDYGLLNVTLITEGVEKAIAAHAAFPYVPVLGVPGIGRLRHIPPVPGVVLIVRDGDEPGSEADKSLTHGVDHLLLSGSETVRVTATPLGLDADKIVLVEGIDSLRQLILAAPAVALSADGEAQRLANLNNILAYEEQRAGVAKRLGVRRSVLDAAVDAKRRAAKGEDTPPDEAAALGPEPWPEPVDDIAAVLDTASDAIGKHVIASPVVRAVTTLWCLFTHFVHHWCIQLPVSPRLEIRAVSLECGKTTLLTLTMFLVSRPMPAASLTPAVVYRVLDKYRPTLILDEVDAQLRSNRNPELNAVLRAFHNRHFAQIPRNVRTADDNWDIELFSAWGTYAYTTIGRIGDDALESRAIRATLLRATPAELTALQPLIDGNSRELLDCGRKFARWARDQTALPDAMIPDIIAARARDDWRPLLRLAAHVGGKWPQRAREAAIAINGVTRAIGDVVPLLTDIREAFGTRKLMPTKELVDAMLALPEPSRDWSIEYRGRQINEYYLRDRLKELVDAPANERSWRVGKRMVRGYRLVHFKDAFERYLPDVASDDTGTPGGEGQLSLFTPTHPSVSSAASATPLNSNDKSPAPPSAAGSPPSAAGSPPSAPGDATDMPVADHDAAEADHVPTSDTSEKASCINAVHGTVADGADAADGHDVEENKNSAEPPRGHETDTETWLPAGDPDAPKSSEGPCAPT
jgi:putative DNA primase/helicase